MISFAVHNTDTDATSVQPGVDSVMDQLKSMMRIANMKTIYVNTINEIRNDKWSVGSLLKDDNKDIDNNIVIVHSDYRDSDNMTARPVTLDNFNKPIISDTAARFDLKPYYVRTTVSLKISILSKSKNKLYSVKEILSRSFRESSDVYNHTIRHTMIIPEPIIDLLEEIHLSKNYTMGTDNTFVEYLQGVSDERVTFGTNQSVDFDKASLIMIENKVGIQGHFTNAVHDISGDDEYYKLDMDYEYTWDRPIYFDLSYNQVAYNCLLPDKYIIVGNSSRQKLNPYMSYDIWLREWFATYRQTNKALSCLREKESYIRIPGLDVHEDIKIPDLLIPVFSVLTTLGEDKKCLGSLKDLDINLSLQDDVLQCLIDKEEYKYITSIFESVFHIILVEDDSYVASKLTVDADLNVCSTKELDPTKSYRYMFCYMYDVVHLTNDALDRLKNACEMDDKVVDVLKYITDEDKTIDEFAKMNPISSTRYSNKFSYLISGIISRLIKIP